MKRIIIGIMMALCLVTAGGLICGIVMKCTSSQEQQRDVEALRDQLKTYQTVKAPEVSVEEPFVSPGVEETVISGMEVSAEEIVVEEILPPETEAETQEPEIQESAITVETIEIIEIPAETEPPETEPLPAETEPVRIPEVTLDFESMWETNPDICAWIEIEGTKVDYPILQSAEDDEKYLTTAVDGSYYIGGSLFTQATYNARDFNDPVTLIYGHTMLSGTLFGQLQPVYSSTAGFEEHSEIKLYLPDDVRYYTVFAAVPYENYHIMHTYDFSNDYWYRNFFKGVKKIRSFGANFNDDITPEPGDHVIILSTCLNEDSTKRFLVMAIDQDDIE